MMHKSTFFLLTVLFSCLVMVPDVQAGRQKQKYSKNGKVSGLRFNADAADAVVAAKNVDAEVKELAAEEAQELAAQEEVVQEIGLSTTKKRDTSRREQAQPVEEATAASLEKYLEKDSAAKVDFDQEAKRNAVIELVDKAAKYLAENESESAFSAFSHGKEFVSGELYVFAYNKEGVCLADGEAPSFIWADMNDYKDIYGVPVVQSILDVAKKGDGWVTYQWRNATKVSYVKSVEKGEDTFILGVGYYPHSKEDAVVNLVKGAVALFNKTLADKKPIEEAFSQMNYKFGRFVNGDLYLYVLDFDGLHYAHGERPGVVGTNGWNYKDSTGKLVNQEIVGKLQKSDTGIWVEYISKRAQKKTYAEKVTDAKGKNYFIACGYYPEANRAKLVELVRTAYQYMKGHGKTKAVEDFNDISKETFRYGDLSIFVYDMKGMCVAYGSNPALTGTPSLDLKDEFGSFYVREFIKKAESGGGWVDYKLNNSFASAYVEKIDLGIESFVIGSFMYPLSKRESALLLAKSAASYLQSHDKKEAFRAFIKRDGMFIRGDLSIAVIDQKGICLAYGDTYDLIWRNLLSVKDDDGKPFIRLFIETMKRGSGGVTYKLNGAEKNVFVEPVEKNNRKYAVSCGFYL